MPQQLGLLSIAEHRETRVAPRSKVAQLAAFFAERPGVWVDGRRLEFAGRYAWRTRVSDLRYAPWHMTIENRVRHLELGSYQVSEYRYVLGKDERP